MCVCACKGKKSIIKDQCLHANATKHVITITHAERCAAERDKRRKEANSCLSRRQSAVDRRQQTVNFKWQTADIRKQWKRTSQAYLYICIHIYVCVCVCVECDSLQLYLKPHRRRKSQLHQWNTDEDERASDRPRDQTHLCYQQWDYV